MEPQTKNDVIMKLSLLQPDALTMPTAFAGLQMGDESLSNNTTKHNYRGEGMDLREAKEYTNWFMSRLMIWFAAGTIVIVFLVINKSGFGRDNTDGDKRSGVALRVDNLTGCNYLEGARGGLTPRLDADGNHFGCK